MNNINIGLISDRSGSVENEKLALENSIKLLIESFKRKYKESTDLKLLLIIFYFLLLIHARSTSKSKILNQQFLWLLQKKPTLNYAATEYCQLKAKKAIHALAWK